MKPYIVSTKGIGLSTCGGRKPQSLLTAARHNLREIQAENGVRYGKINPEKTSFNRVLIGANTAKEVERFSHVMFDRAGIDREKKRKDYTQAHEAVISVDSDEGAAQLFDTIAANADYIFGAGVVLSFVIHNDQTKPHCHVLTSPIEAGAYVGSKRMKAEKLTAFKERLDEVTKPIGFARKEKTQRRDIGNRAAGVFDALERLGHPMLSDPLWPALMRMIQKDPSPLFELLGLSDQWKPSTLAGERLKKQSKPRHCKTPPKKDRSLSCVGFALNNDVQDAVNQPVLSLAMTPEVLEVVRVRDAELSPENFDPISGEFMQRPPNSRGTAKLATDRLVANALRRRA